MRSPDTLQRFLLSRDRSSGQFRRVFRVQSSLWRYVPRHVCGGNEISPISIPLLLAGVLCASAGKFPGAGALARGKAQPTSGESAQMDVAGVSLLSGPADGLVA